MRRMRLTFVRPKRTDLRQADLRQLRRLVHPAVAAAVVRKGDERRIVQRDVDRRARLPSKAQSIERSERAPTAISIWNC